MRGPDLITTVRTLRRRPAFTVTAILLLALGAAANALVFSVVRGVLLRPLPYAHAEALVSVWPDGFVSNEEIGYWREHTRTLEQIAGLSPGWLMALVADGVEPVKATGARTSDNFFTTLGAHAALGRTIQPGDGVPGRRVVVLGYPLFEQQFASDPAVVGRIIRLDNEDHEVIGVMPRGFEFIEPGTDLWSVLPFDPGARQHRAQFSLAVARLAGGANVEMAERELRGLLPAMRAGLAKPADWGHDLRAVSLRERVVGDVRPTLLLLLAAVGLVLLLAAANLGTLTLGRSLERAREFAVRASLGASRGRLVRQLLLEQAILATAGAVLGLVVGQLALPALLRALPPELPRQGEIHFDVIVFTAVIAATLVASLSMALLPVVLAASPHLLPLLNQREGTESKGRRRVLGALVAAQVALAAVLGIGAGLMLRTLYNLQQVDPGFDPERVLTFRLQTTSRNMALTEGLVYFEQVVERLRALPGVERVGAVGHLPMSGYNWTTEVWPVDRPPAPGASAPTAMWRFVGWDYFESMGIPLVAGRRFTTADRNEAPGAAIVNEAFATRTFGSAAAALGQRLHTTLGRGAPRVEIVGVIRDLRFVSLDTPAAPEVYRPLAQTFMFPMAFVVRATGEPAALAPAVRQAAFAVDPTIPVAEMQPLTALLAETLGRPRLLSLLLGIFAAAGLALGIVGLYGVVAYRVRQQEREFGIRLALGASPAAIARGVFGQALRHTAIGLLLGIPAALAATRVMASMLFGVTARDAATFTVLPALIALTAVAACVLPARRAAHVDPIRTMRAD